MCQCQVFQGTGTLTPGRHVQSDMLRMSKWPIHSTTAPRTEVCSPLQRETSSFGFGLIYIQPLCHIYMFQPIAGCTRCLAMPNIWHSTLPPSSWGLVGELRPEFGLTLSVHVEVVAPRNWWRHDLAWPNIYITGLICSTVYRQLLDALKVLWCIDVDGSPGLKI